MAASRSANGLSPNDPLQPLRAMADRVGKEVEKFAERVDHWHTHGNENTATKYHTTVKLVDKFRDLAESTVRDLKKKSSMDNQGELDKSVRRRIKGIANDEGQRLFAESTRSILPSIEPSATPDSSSVRELRHWQAELATWELMRVIIEHHHPEPGTDVAAKKAARLADVGGTSRYSPKNEVWDRFVLEDDAAREKKIILKWLQQTAKNTESDIDSIIDQWGSVSGKDTNTWTSGWLDTKAKIKQAKRMQGAERPLDEEHTIHSQSSVAPLVTRLDPDAPLRQKRALEKSDDFYENALWMVCYEMLRRGEPWEKISEWCKERNEAWRGVSLGAAYTTHPDGGPNVAGNDLGYLFRRMCFYASRGAKLPYEGAVYGLLSGDFKQVHETCRSWDDQLYAYYNALLLSRFDRYLRQNPQPYPWVSDKSVLDFVFQDESSNVDHWETSNQQVIELLMRNTATSEEAKTPIKLIQGALISGTIEDLLYKVGVAVADMLQDDNRPVNLIIDPDTENMDEPTSKKATEHRAVSAEGYYQALARDPHALRLLAHICIIFREGLETIPWQKDPEAYAMQNVVVAYIELLRVTKRIQLIPLYAALIGRTRGYHCMARILPDIKNNDEQKRCVTLMKSYRVDAVEVVRANFQLTLLECGLVSKETLHVPNPISRFPIVEKWTGKDAYLWPGLRIQQTVAGFDITPKEEALLESLQWFGHLDAEYEQTFNYLEITLATLLRKYSYPHLGQN
jgi:nuclear pore complex protein Nup107